jgi:hypothetical protein
LKVFNIDVTTINWPSYIDIYTYGTKKYILKENMTDEPKHNKEVKSSSNDKQNPFLSVQNFMKYSVFLVLFPVFFFVEYSHNFLAFIITISTILLKTL